MPEVGEETRFCLNDWVHMIHFYVGLWLHIPKRVAGSVIEYRFVSESRSPDVKLLLIL